MSISGVAILLPVSEGVGLCSQPYASLSGHLCVVRQLPSGEYSRFLPAGAVAVRCADGAILGALCRAEFTASVALGPDVAEPILLVAARRLVFSRILSPPSPDPGTTTTVSSVPLSGSDSPRS